MKTFARYAAPSLVVLSILSGCGGGAGGDSGGGTPVHPSAKISVATDGTQANNALTFLSAKQSGDGRWVAFISNATNLVPGDTNDQVDVFLRDNQTGTTTRIGLDTYDFPTLSMSLDGESIAYHSFSLDGIAVYDRLTQTTDTIGAGGIETSLSADGRYLAFATEQALEPSDHNGFYDVYVYDRDLDTFTRVSETTAGAEGNEGSDMPEISGDGSTVVFRSWASDLVTGDTNGVPDVFLHQRGTHATSRISVKTGGAQMTGSAGAAVGAAVSYDGSRVIFNFEKDTSTPGVWLRNVTGGTTSSVASDGIGLSLSSDGRYLVYADGIVNLGEFSQVYVADLQTATTRRLTWSTSGGAPNGHSGWPNISGDGNWIVFQSAASNLMDGDTNGKADLFRIANPLKN